MVPAHLITPENQLGRGGESGVYGLDAAHIVRVYRPGAEPAYLDARHSFYGWLSGQGLPFATPRILEVGRFADSVVAGQHYSVEARMPGRDMAQVLPSLRGGARAEALRSFVAAAMQLGRVHVPAGTAYGELVSSNPLRHDDWREFLIARMHQALQQSVPVLARDVPELAARIAAFERDARALPLDIPKRLVHGDYFPANVFLGDDLTITGVGDFSYATVAGDPRYDLMGALGFLELVEGCTAADSEQVQAELHVQHDPMLHPDLFAAIAFYRCFAAFVFSPCLDDDPATYAWCVATLRAA